MRKNGLGLELPRATIGVSRWRRFRASVDWPLIITMVLLCTVGMLNLYSATRSVGHDAKFDKQVQWMIVGGIGFIAITVIDYRTLVRLAWFGLGLAVLLLLVARLFGHHDQTHHGDTYRWLNVGGMGIQPSELATIAAIPVLARLFGDAEPASYAPAYFAPRLAVLLVPIGLIAVQPDLGTAVLLTLIVLTVGFLAMPNVWPMVYTMTGLLLAVPILWEKLHTYQKDRLLGFIDCNVTQSKTCWHTMQSIYAVGSGRVWGKGFLDGTQNRYGYVPENLTDFPFARLAEEWGFAGSVALLAIFGFLLIWTINVALSARDRVGSVICVGVAAMTFWHVIVNVAMVLGLAPVVGVTLPFVSYGGSSLVTFFLAMGLVANVSLRKHGY
jgi:rod shape determining protein RodA